MPDLTLAQAVERFAQVTQALADADLERAWAWGDYDEGVRYAFFRTYEELRELAAITATGRAAQGPQFLTAQRALAQYHAAYRDLQALLIGVSDAELDRAPAAGEWPLRRVLEHVVEAENSFYVVVRYALERRRSGDGRPAKIPEPFWDAVSGPEEAPFKQAMSGTLQEMLAYYDRRHEHVLREFAPIDEDEVSAPSQFWEEYELPLQFRLHRFDSHLRQHTIQTEKTLDGIGRRPGEAQRLLRLIYAALAEAEGAALGAAQAGAELQRSAAAAIGARAEEVAAALAYSEVQND